MALIKLVTSFGVFVVVYSLQNLIFFELFLWVIKLGLLAAVSWFIGSRIARIIIMNRLLPPVCPKNKAVLITGCDSGFGHWTALKLNRRGFYIFATCLDEKGKGGSELMKKAKFPDKMKVLGLNVTKEEDVSNVVDQVSKIVSEKRLELHAIVNNAGICEVGDIEWSESGPSVEDYKRAMDVNCFGVIRVTRGFLPLLRKSRGRIVNLTSIMSRTNYPGINPYCVSKAAAVKFTDGLQAEITRFGVTPVSIEPWYYKTPLLNVNTVTTMLRKRWEKASPEVRSDYGDEYFESMIRGAIFTVSSPHNVIDRPEDVVEAIEDAVTSITPEPVYRVITPGLGIIFWILHDLLPWDLSFTARRIQHWAALKFLVK